MSLHSLTMAMLIGGILCILVLVAFLYEWRVATISVVAMPLSLVAAGLVLSWRGATINVVVLAGFVVGLGEIVDAGVNDIQTIVRRRRPYHQGRGSSPALTRMH